MAQPPQLKFAEVAESAEQWCDDFSDVALLAGLIKVLATRCESLEARVAEMEGFLLVTTSIIESNGIQLGETSAQYAEGILDRLSERRHV